MKKLILIPLVLISVLCFGQIKNAGFEDWDTVNTHGYDQYSPTNWKAINLTGVERITDSFTGNKSVMIHTWYFYATTSIYQIGALDFKPAYLRGKYKNIPGGTNKPSKGIINLILTKTSGKVKDTVSNINYFLDTSSVFIPFLFPLDYTSELMPDSFFIQFNNGFGPCNDGSCQFLYLDDIAFVRDTSLSVPETKELSSSINVYPNPTNGILNIENKDGSVDAIQLYNSIGEFVAKNILTQNHNTIEMNDLPAGIYFYNLVSNGTIVKAGKLIKN